MATIHEMLYQSKNLSHITFLTILGICFIIKIIAMVTIPILKLYLMLKR